MEISTRSLSNVLNKHFNQNFYDFENHYRIIDAKAQLCAQASKDKSIKRIFESAWLDSKAAFNTLFKKTTGQTPSEFRAQLQAA
ncbi:helix-turn-helix domain-containing protein [Aliiglaciecola lipolytica]|uniref:HTH araC/xylS-type domain-containing protein n=1 Tax=Aliiglaciecola lipolytica E3 TaxID=1127673 RepID=K6YDL5_9ALTE|nr:helix-turn-helix domain-containing protein [Aliiglaciecola lipolytica]GAC14738.1 hypothetical protein GLIP_2110 [Aliiglaciecola lipolytica E3]